MDEPRQAKVLRFVTTQSWVLLLIDAHHFTLHCLADLLTTCDEQLEVRKAVAIADIDPDDCEGCDVVMLRLDALDPGDGGLRRSLAELSALLPGVPVAVLSGACDMETALAAVRCGVRGYLSPMLGIDQILAALRLVRAGGVYLAPAEAALPLPDAQPALRPAPPPLTPREAQVLHHLRQGKPNKLIAYELGMSENTVKAHVGHILRKLGASNRTIIAGL